MSRRAVEGLPLKYIIIAIVAALVIGILINITQILGEGITAAAVKLNSTLNKTLSDVINNM